MSALRDSIICEVHSQVVRTVKPIQEAHHSRCVNSLNSRFFRRSIPYMYNGDKRVLHVFRPLGLNMRHSTVLTSDTEDFVSVLECTVERFSRRSPALRTLCRWQAQGKCSSESSACVLCWHSHFYSVCVVQPHAVQHDRCKDFEQASAASVDA